MVSEKENRYTSGTDVSGDEGGDKSRPASAKKKKKKKGTRTKNPLSHFTKSVCSCLL